MKKLFLMLLVVSMISSSITASAAQQRRGFEDTAQGQVATDELGTLLMVDGMMVYLPRASKQLDSYSINLTDKGNGVLKVYYAVYGTHDGMACVGAKSIVIEEEVTKGVWVEYQTFSTLYDYGVLYCSDAFEVSVIPGGRYRAVLTAYARDVSGSDTGEVTSKTVVAS